MSNGDVAVYLSDENSVWTELDIAGICLHNLSGQDRRTEKKDVGRVKDCGIAPNIYSGSVEHVADVTDVVNHKSPIHNRTFNGKTRVFETPVIGDEHRRLGKCRRGEQQQGQHNVAHGEPQQFGKPGPQEARVL